MAYVRINVHEVRAILRSQNLKIWWVAEFAGIHKTTLRRWLSGSIEKVDPVRAEKLARVLLVDSSRITKKL